MLVEIILLSTKHTGFAVKHHTELVTLVTHVHVNVERLELFPDLSQRFLMQAFLAFSLCNMYFIHGLTCSGIFFLFFILSLLFI